MLIGIGIGFEMPIVIFFLTKMGVVSTAFLRKNRKYAILLTFIGAAIFTPPDPVTQCIMAGPLIILYEMSIHISKISGRKKVSEDQTLEEEGRP